MFLRFTIRKKNGKEHRYYSLVENRRVSLDLAIIRTEVATEDLQSDLIAPIQHVFAVPRTLLRTKEGAEVFEGRPIPFAELGGDPFFAKTARTTAAALGLNLRPIIQVESFSLLMSGEINDNQQEAWRKTIEISEEGKTRPQTVALFPADRIGPVGDADIVRLRLKELSLHRPRQWGACWLAGRLWEQLGGWPSWSGRWVFMHNVAFSNGGFGRGAKRGHYANHITTQLCTL